MTNIAMENRWPIEIDGLAGLAMNSMVDLSMANCECHNQMVPFFFHVAAQLLALHHEDSTGSSVR